MRAILAWDHRVLAVGGDGFFKVLIRRRHGDHPVWAWALEWNHNFRIIGFCGHQMSIVALTAALPELELEFLNEGPSETLWYRVDQPLEEADDNLFSCPEFLPPAL